ncbi:MAG TPA: nitroreductase family protein [Nitrospirae bacterium]|nr:5,6-dimethylbenzimidazole synthase [bacterium BMS3Abin06]HDH12739.1 nitroreductase family protein [Nitrospirota bacterium]HDZ00048.1 nitroreductase family protein [Nitrospirota bacterium]
MMDVFEAIKNRRSIRRFEERPVPEELVRKIIEAGQWAPSACNRQAWKFIIIESEEVKERLLKETTAYFAGKAPLLIFVLYSNRTDNLEYKDHLLSAAMAIQNMQLAAYSLGIGACCVNNLPVKSRLRKILNIPRSYDPVALLCMGYPKAVPGTLKRKEDLDAILCKNSFSFQDDYPGVDIKLILKRIIRFIYYRLPASLKKLLDPVARKFEKKFDT